MTFWRRESQEPKNFFPESDESKVVCETLPEGQAFLAGGSHSNQSKVAIFLKDGL